MADKEERISIHQVLYPCEKCSINCNKNDWKDCDFYQNYISGMTRAEAVEIMAKILCQLDTETNDCTECCNENNKNACRCILTDEGYIARAEAELDALLGGKK